MALVEPGVIPRHGAGLTALDERGAGPSRRLPSQEDLALLSSPGGTGRARVLTGPLPHGWLQAIVAPLEADGAPLGHLLLGTRERSRPLGPAELTLLTPLASALAVALRGAAHLRRLTEETSKLQAVVDQSSDGILVLDGAGVVQLWSPAIAALAGRPESAAVGLPLGDVIVTTGTDGASCDPFAAGRDLITAAAPQATVELGLLRPDGEQRVVRCAHAGVFALGVLVRDVVIVHDVTRERQVERLKADFIATVSHELRTPVTPIKGYADLLRRRGDAMTPERRNECLDVISDRCDHLVRLVEDLLLASRISATDGSAAAQVSLGTGDLTALVRRASGDFGADGGRLRLALPVEPVVVRCDPVRVIQVLSNLLGNALKYSAPGSPVDVRLSVGEQWAQVDVTDVGRGIPADQLEQVFEKFHRVEDPMRMTTGGTGLGLYIARQLADAMKGRLTCSSTLGWARRSPSSSHAAATPTSARDPRHPGRSDSVPTRPRLPPEVYAPEATPARRPAADLSRGGPRGRDLQRVLREVQGEARLRRRGQGQRVRPPDGAGTVPGVRHQDEPDPRQGLSPARGSAARPCAPRGAATASAAAHSTGGPLTPSSARGPGWTAGPPRRGPQIVRTWSCTGSARSDARWGPVSHSPCLARCLVATRVR
jgi:signal transduction histidine kinase